MNRQQKKVFFTAEYTRSGLVTLPYEYMKSINIDVGDIIKFEVNDDYIKITNAKNIVEDFRINEGYINENSDIE